MSVGCDDLLSIKSPDSLVSDMYWRDSVDAEAGLAAAYSQLENSVDIWAFPEIKFPVEEFKSDLNIMGEDAAKYPSWVELYNFTYTNGNSQFTSYWENNYRGIQFANQVIAKVGAMDEESISLATKNSIVAEAKFLRAYYHFKLLLNWEKIVVRTVYESDPLALDKALSERPEAWKQIIADLKDAAAVLPVHWDKYNKGRATSATAFAYLGYAWLTRAYEEPELKSEALSAAIAALDEDHFSGYDLVPMEKYLGMFDGTNKNSEESLFELQYSNDEGGGAYYKSAIHRWIGVSELWGWDEILPSEKLMEEYFKEGQIATTGRYDSRLYSTVFYRCDYFNDGQGKVYGWNYDDWFCDENEVPYDRPAYRKYMPSDYAGLENERTAINLPLMRYSNVLLMLAEAYNESGRPELAIPLINRVRHRADMPDMNGSTKAEVAAQIEHERILEFPLESYRFYDLRRWGKLEDAMRAAGRVSFTLSKGAFYPTPLSEINANAQVTK